MKYILPILFLSLVMSSCSVKMDLVKRKYNKGWHANITTNKSKTKIIKNHSQDTFQPVGDLENINYKNLTDETATENNVESIEAFIASSDNTIIYETRNIPILFEQKRQKIKKDNECDLIILKNGKEINAKVLEVGASEIKYKMCDNLEGPTFSKNKSEVFMIKYPNGSSTVMSKTDDKPSTGTSGKSQLVAFLLCFFIGLLGIHRFYLGHTGIGIVQLLTAGMCGIWSLIDLIMILTGDLKPKNGDYSETL